jgi:hypothetical protein
VTDFECRRFPGLSVGDFRKFFKDHGISAYLPTDKDCQWLDRQFVVKVCLLFSSGQHECCSRLQ